MPSRRNGCPRPEWARLVQRKNITELRRREEREVEQEVAQQFRKKFQFSPIDDGDQPPELPPVASICATPAYTVEKLQKVKRDLNAVKSRLNDFEISDWHQHTRRRSSLYAILNDLRHRVRGEFVTQAFAKLYECVASYDLVPQGQAEFYSVHLCEAPGAFITGLNHYIKTNRANVRWQWFANTLNPYYEGNCLGNMITDDRFILHTVDSWCFGEDYTGDIMQRQNLDAIVRRSKEFPMEHETIHTGEVLYTCNFCPKTFNSNSNLYSHRRKMHPIEYAEWKVALQLKKQPLAPPEAAVGLGPERPPPPPVPIELPPFHPAVVGLLPPVVAVGLQQQHHQISTPPGEEGGPTGFM